MSAAPAKTTLKGYRRGAGYSRGLASYRFGSKDGLWMELFARLTTSGRRTCPGIFDGQEVLPPFKRRFRRSGIFLPESRVISGRCISSGTSLGARVGYTRQSGQPPCDLSPRRSAVDRAGAGIWRGQGGRRPGTSLPAIALTMFGTIYQWVVARTHRPEAFLNTSPQR
ncbi:MAG: hypothetical protein CM15mP74_08920 [Halieaceae bacterium]|nr:MAG: hypothetical protein CM15mP74_08920 [Halieaceae bacterium]